MRILGIDPGPRNTGAAILSGETVLWHKYLSEEQSRETALADPIARWHRRLRAVVERYRVAVVVCEDHVFQGQERAFSNLIACAELIGAIRALGAMDGVQVHLLHPREWRRQLTRNPQAHDHEVAFVVQVRVGIAPLEIYGRSRGAHVLDALGVALAWQDQWRVASGAAVQFRARTL
jgi:Holliday junction resolvasome RuvABC endonuclease subunit